MQDRHDMLIHWLRRLNWKERYYLVDQVLGTDGFKLSPEFLNQLDNEIGCEVPKDAFAAMDFHLDWLYAALSLSAKGITGDGCWEEPENVATGKQTDTDLLVAFKRDRQSHIVLIEAKAKGAWDNTQMCAKVKRNIEIFGNDGSRWPDVVPHFVMMSRRRDRKYSTGYWAPWMKKGREPFWIPLRLPDDLSSLYRADKDGLANIDGNWHAVSKTVRRRKH